MPCQSNDCTVSLQVKQREAAFAASGEKEAARAVRVSCDDYLRQMGYREYSRYLSFHFPFTHERSLLEHLRACPWKWNQSHFKVRCRLQSFVLVYLFTLQRRFARTAPACSIAQLRLICAFNAGTSQSSEI